jgi:anti-anti-sigma regulatory factor
MSAENGFDIRVEDAAGCRVASVNGALCLNHAAELQQALVAAVRNLEAKALLLDVSGATDLDLSGMQLLCATHRASLAGDASFDLQGAPEWFWQKARAAGYNGGKLVCDLHKTGGCIWK